MIDPKQFAHSFAAEGITYLQPEVAAGLALPAEQLDALTRVGLPRRFAHLNETIDLSLERLPTVEEHLAGFPVGGLPCADKWYVIGVGVVDEIFFGLGDDGAVVQINAHSTVKVGYPQVHLVNSSVERLQECLLLWLSILGPADWPDHEAAAAAFEVRVAALDPAALTDPLHYWAELISDFRYGY